MLNFNDAYKIINERFETLIPEGENVNLLDSLNRVLACDIYSDIDMPPFDNSAMDGYAVRYDHEITQWEVTGEISAGNFNENFSVYNNNTISIMTGSKIPSGADTVIPVEDVQTDGNLINLNPGSKYYKGMNIRLKGNDLQKDNIAIPKNTLLKPNILTLAAACGINTLNVYSPLKIGILITGDELVNFFEKPENDKIRATNNITLTALIKEINMIPVNFGIVKDDKSQIKAKLIEALNSDIDILVTSGGVSVGKYDFLQEILIELGAEVVFWKVNIKPGKPLLFCKYVRDGKAVLIFGMPGNPVSTFVNFSVFVKPNILEIYGIQSELRFNCILNDDIYKHDNKRHFINGRYSLNNYNEYTVKKTDGQNSGNLPNLGNSNCLIVFEEEKECLKRGEEVECIRI